MSARSRAERAGKKQWEPFQQIDPGMQIANEWWDETWANNKYVVHMRTIDALFTNEGGGQGKHLSIRLMDRSHLRDWREFQRIKNELCGPEWEGVELYPAESRLVDGANQYHLFCFPPPFKFPFGYTERSVIAKGSKEEALVHKLYPAAVKGVQR